MSLSPAEVWKLLLDRARQELPDQTFQAWLEPTDALSIEGGVLFVGAPDQFTADWNESKHAESTVELLSDCPWASNERGLQGP